MAVGSDGSVQSSANEMQTVVTREELSLIAETENSSFYSYSIKNITKTGFRSRRLYSRKL